MTASEITGKVIVNGSATYECYYIQQRTGDTTFAIVVKNDDFDQIKSDFNSVSSLDIYSVDNVLLKSMTKFTTTETIETRDGVYVDEVGNYVDAFRVVLKDGNLEEMVNQLNEKVFPVVDYDSMSIAEYQDIYIQKSKDMLAEYLESHPITSSAHNGKSGVYSVTKDKQDLMASNYLSYTLEKANNPDAEITWNETGKECEVWTEEEFVQLIIEIKQYVKPLVSHQQEIETQIRSLTSKKEIAQVEIGYEEIGA